MRLVPRVLGHTLFTKLNFTGASQRIIERIIVENGDFESGNLNGWGQYNPIKNRDAYTHNGDANVDVSPSVNA